MGPGGRAGFPNRSPHAHIIIRRDHHVIMTGKSKLGVMSKHRLVVVKNQSTSELPRYSLLAQLVDIRAERARTHARTTATRHDSDGHSKIAVFQ